MCLGNLGNELIALNSGTYNVSTSAESTLANFYCNAMLASAESSQTLAVCLINGGSFEKNLGPGPITIQTLMETYPRQDTIVRMLISGDTLMSALKHGSSGYPKEGRFAQVGNLRYSFWPIPNQNSASGLVTSIGIALIVSNGSTYGVGGSTPNIELVTSSYLADGNDGYTMLKGNKIVSNSTENVNEAVGEYLEANTPLALYPEGRIVNCMRDNRNDLCNRALFASSEEELESNLSNSFTFRMKFPIISFAFLALGSVSLW